MSPFEGRRGIRRAFRLSTPRRAREDVDAELRFHLDGYADDLVRQGYSREQAEAEARRRFGDVTRIREECTMIDTQGRRRRDRGEQLATLVREARQSLRALVRARSFSAIAIITLALGIGAATAIFTLLDSVVLRPLPYVAPDRLVFLSSPVPGYKPGAEWGLSQAGYFFFRKENRSFDDIGVYAAPMLTLARDGHAERVQGAVVTASLLHVLRVGPALGRAITPEDDRPNVAPVAMLGYDFWRTRFGGDPRVIGQVIDLEGQRIQVVGVMRRGAGLPDLRVDVWLPEQLDPLRTPVNSHMNFAGAIARLKPGVTLEAANADLARLTARLPDVFPTVYTPSFMSSTRFATRAVSLRDHVVGSTARVLWILLAAVGLVLVIACANVANLFLVRAESRRREVAVRTALGADRWRIASHYVTESVLLALVAGALAVGLAYGGIRLFLAIAPSELPRLAEVRVTWGAVGVALVFSLAAGVLFGLFPLLRGGRATVDVITLRQGRGLSGSRGQHAIRGALVVAQVALALVLLAGAGLLLRSYDRLRQVQPGFDPHGVVAVDVALPYVRYRDYEA
ncbi:MAG TPA: ABC transporter permease, partial [Gemmatimonadaceae bacterium]